MRIGDHISVSRGVYTHHGIFVGEGDVIHYTGEPGSKRNAAVRRDTLATFLEGGVAEVVPYCWSHSPAEVVCRAESRLGEQEYHVVTNNDEHFARWCKTGEGHSEQVNDGASAVVGVTGGSALAVGSLGIVSAAGSVAGLSGAGVMSGLAAVGGTIGTGAVGGLGVLAAGPAVVASVAMRQALRDDESLPSDERDARRVGRTATIVGAATGVGGSIAAVSAMGTVAGLSGTGITSGLFAIGSTVGGGMVTGVGVTMCAPAVAAAAVGYGQSGACAVHRSPPQVESTASGRPLLRCHGSPSPSS